MKTKIITLFILSLLVMSCTSTKTANQSMTKKFDRNQQPTPGPAPKINLGQPQTFSLANGLKVLVVENHKLPRVSARLSIDNDPLYEGEKSGTAELLSALLGTGTNSISKDDFNEKVDFLGAHISYGSTSARMSALSKFFPEVFALMADGALDPVFAKEEFDKEVAKAIDGVKSGEKSVSTIASRVENILSYGGKHPYGAFTSVASIKRIQLDDVKKLYHTYFKPNNAYLVVVGDVNYEEIKKLVTANFGSWKKGTLPTYTMPVVNNVAKTELNFIDMPNASQSQVNVMSTTQLKMSDADYHAVLVANQIFGGDFNSHLNMNLREAHGYTYGARSGLRPNKYISRFKAGAQVRNEVVDSTVVEIMKELKRIRTEKVTDEELKNVKASYAGKFVMAVEKPETVARYALNIEKNNLDKDFYKNFLQKINAVTAADVLRVAQKYFNKDHARIVVTSKGIDVIPALEKLGYPIAYFDKEGNKTAKPKMPTVVSADITPKIVLEKYFKAKGGKDKMAAITTLVMTEEMTVNGMLLTQTTKHKAPNKMQIEVTMMGQVAARIVFDGTEGYMEQMGRKVPLPEDRLAKIKSKKGIFSELYIAEDNELTLDGIVAVNGKDCYKMLVKNAKNTVYKYFDVDSGLILKKEEIEVDPRSGEKVNTPMYYFDYKPVNGIMFAHKKTTKQMGQEVEMQLKSLELNTDLPAETFK